MRTLTATQNSILNGSGRVLIFLFEIDIGATGTIDYYWSKQTITYDSQLYTHKIDDHSELSLSCGYLGDPNDTYLLPASLNIDVLFPNSVLDGYYASDFENAAITVRLIGKATGYSFTELLTWGFRVQVASSVNQILSLTCRDWLHSGYLEGGYPNNPILSDLFPNNATENDDRCVPESLGLTYFPCRCVPILHDSNQALTYVNANSFTLSGDHTAQYVSDSCGLVNLGVDGERVIYIDTSVYGAGTTTVVTKGTSGDLTSNLTNVLTYWYCLGIKNKANPTYTIYECKSPRETEGTMVFDQSNFDFIQAVIQDADNNSYAVYQPLLCDGSNNGVADFIGVWGTPTRYDLPTRFSRDDTASLTNPAVISEYLLEGMGVPSAQIDATLQAAAATIYTNRSFSLNVPLEGVWDSELLLCKLFTVAGMRLNYRDLLGVSVLTSASQKTITYDDVIPYTFSSTRSVAIEDQKDIGYMVWQSNQNPNYPEELVKKAVSVKTSTTNYADCIIECDWVNTEANALKATKLALQRSLLKNRTIKFQAYIPLINLEPGDFITINDTNLGKEASSYDVMITRITISNPPNMYLTFECIAFRDTIDDWDDVAPTAPTTTTVSDTNVFRSLSSGPLIHGITTGYAPNEIDKALVILDQAEINCKTGGSLSLQVGADIFLNSSDTDPAIINWVGSSYLVKIGANTAGTKFLIRPDTDDSIDFEIGSATCFWGAAVNRFQDITTNASQSNAQRAGTFSGSHNGAAVRCDGNDASSEPSIVSTLQDKTAGTSRVYNMKYDSFAPGTIQSQDLGLASNRWRYGYANTWIGLDTDQPLVLTPNASASAPTHSATLGTIYLTSACVMYVNTDGSTSWSKIGTQ